MVGGYVSTFSILQMSLTLVFGIVAYSCASRITPTVSVLLGFILGPDLELYFRRGLSLDDGNPMIFLTSPDSLFSPSA